MTRVPYRRYREPGQRETSRAAGYRESQYHADHEDENDGALGQTLILQGIISGIILVAVMLVSIITLPILEPAQHTLAQTLSGPTTPAELIDDARQFGVDTLGWQWLE